jgi:hypothetical protein
VPQGFRTSRDQLKNLIAADADPTASQPLESAVLDSLRHGAHGMDKKIKKARRPAPPSHHAWTRC